MAKSKGKKGPTKKQRVKKVKLNMFDRRIVQTAIDSLLQSERNSGHDPKLITRRMKVAKIIDVDEVEDHFEHIKEAVGRGEKITKDDRQGDGDHEFVFRQGMYYWIKERMEQANYFGMYPSEVVESLGKWGIEFDDDDLWGDDEVEEVEEVEEVVEVVEEEEEEEVEEEEEEEDKDESEKEQSEEPEEEAEALVKTE